MNTVLLRLNQDSFPQIQLTIADSSDVSRGYFTLTTEKLSLYENQKDQSLTCATLALSSEGCLA